MVRRPRHRLFFSPFVSGRIVFVVRPPSFTLAPAPNHVHFAIYGNPEKFFIRLRKRCPFFQGDWGGILATAVIAKTTLAMKVKIHVPRRTHAPTLVLRSNCFVEVLITKTSSAAVGAL